METASTLQLTDCRIFPSRKNDGPLNAFVTIILNHGLVVSGIQILEGKKALYLRFPMQEGKTGKVWWLPVYPATSEARQDLSCKILASYVISCVDDPIEEPTA